MHGKISHELEVKVPGSEVWAVYGTLRLGKLIEELLPDLVQKIQVVQGDGGAGTVLKITFPPGTPRFDSYKEKFTKVDDNKRLKETEVIEGGLLELGFRLYRVRFQILEKDTNSSIIQSSIEYEINDEFASNASFVTTKPLEIVAKAIGKYLMEKKTDEGNSHV